MEDRRFERGMGLLLKVGNGGGGGLENLILMKTCLMYMLNKLSEIKIVCE